MKSRKDNFEKNFIFNVPQNFRFSKFEKLKETPDIDFDNEDDVWFTLDHPQLQITDEEQAYQEVNVPQVKFSDKKEVYPHQKEKKQLKRAKIIQKSSERLDGYSLRSNSKLKKNFVEKESKKTNDSKQEKAKSVKMGSQASFKIKRPCPYSLRIQRTWELKSKKSWYELSEESAKKAAESMKKLSRPKARTPQKKSRNRFRF